MHLCDEKSFEEIRVKILNKVEINLSDYSIKSYYLDKIFNGLEFILKKIIPNDIVKKIFSGSDIISSFDMKSDQYNNLSKKEIFLLKIDTPEVSYISHKYINEIYKHFINENGDGIFFGFDENELNENKVYGNWEKTYLEIDGNERKECLFAECFKNEYLKIKNFYKEAIDNKYIIFVEIR
jgi:hypothetical protein